ncbi:MAG: nicotianamine synthase family protein [Coriobacteriia bacterium]|nr:nicotianamine synthase family protein [Coriobacteriia bacterium]
MQHVRSPAHEPRAFLLDEPTNSLDLRNQLHVLGTVNMDNPYHRHSIDQELAECCLDCETSLESIKRHLLAFYDTVLEFAPDAQEDLAFDDVCELYAELDDVIRLHAPGDSLVAALLTDPDVSAVLPDLRDAHSSFFRLHERRFAEELLQNDEPWTTLQRFVYFPNYVALVDAEVHAASLHAGDKVLFVGCGPLPLTNILLAAHHDVHTIAVETDADLADLADRVVQRLGLSERIEAVRGDHRWLSVGRIPDLVMVAAQANPRRQILQHLLDVLPKGARVSLRTYEKGMRRILAGDEDLSLPEEFVVVDKVDPGPPVNNTVVLIERV